jgi:dipeptide transport system ATP-binding protein
MAATSGSAAVLQLHEVTRHYRLRGGLFGKRAVVKAVDGISFSLAPGKTLAVVGESGCGKSTLARLVTMIEAPTSGAIMIEGENVSKANRRALRRFRGDVQIVFQNPYGSLNPRQRVGTIIGEPLLLNRRDMGSRERRRAVFEALHQVGLSPQHYDRYPHMFSGGQRQRIAIARAIVLRPRILVLDEPVSALDLSVQAQILNLLADLQERLGLAYVFISHSLGVVRHVADEVLVMYLGRTVEFGSRDAIFEDPRHPYTQALLSATPAVDPARRGRRIAIEGEPPSPINPPQGCAFHPRCPLAFDRCKRETPRLTTVAGRYAACFAAAATA